MDLWQTFKDLYRIQRSNKTGLGEIEYLLRTDIHPSARTMYGVSEANSYVEALTPNATVFGGRAFWKSLRLNKVMRVGSYSNRSGGLIRTGEQFLSPRTLTKKRPREDTVRRWPFASRGEGSPQKPKWPAL